MRSPSSIKQEFLRKWIIGLRKYSSQKKNMNFLERKKAIKLCADVAMASTRGETTRWSQALIVNASKDDNNKVLTEHILGSTHPQHCQKLKSFANWFSFPLCIRRIRSRKILKRSRTIRHRVKERRVMANIIAKRLVDQKGRRRLKRLLPGGEFMDDVSLLEETLDYVESLRAQVEVMRCLVTASELSKKIPS